MPLPAPFAFKVGTFTRNLGTGNQAIAEVGFKPRAVILIQCGNTALATWQGVQFGPAVSMFTADGESGSVFTSANDALAMPTTNIRTGIFQKAHYLVFHNGNPSAEADLVSMDSGGFTLNWVATDGVNAQRIIYIALAGNSLGAKVKKWQMPTYSGTSVRPVTGVGFSPDVVLHIYCSAASYNVTTPTLWQAGDFVHASNRFRMGAMDKYGNQWALNAITETNVNPTQARRSLKDDYCFWGETVTLGVVPKASYVSMDTDGFTLRFELADGQPGWVVSLALRGVEAKVGTFDKTVFGAPTSQSIVGVGFKPAGLILAGVQATGFGTVTHQEVGIGAASAVGSEAAIATIYRDNVATSISKKLTDARIYLKADNATPAVDAAASLSSFDADGFTLGWESNDAVATKVAYVALAAHGGSSFGTGTSGSGGVWVPGHRFEMELTGYTNGWTDVTQDVMLEAPPVSVDYGIAGTGPLDLVGTTGQKRLGLNNGESNSAGLLGYYSPGHANCRPGFKLGIRVRYTYVLGGGDPAAPNGYGKFIGRLREIDPKPGKHRDRKTVCSVVDWMNEAATTKFNLATQIGKRHDQVLASVLALMPRQPDVATLTAGDSTFPYAVDNGPTERSTVMTEIQRLCQSEYARCYIRGGLNLWGELRLEKRSSRLGPVAAFVFDGSMQVLDAGSETAKIKNKVKVTAHPRRVDAAATTVLFAKPNQSNPSVQPSAVLKLSGRYVDPANPNARVGGIDMVAPVATTDYLMNAAADGSGANLTANFAVVPFYGANQVDYTITNNGGTAGYITKLQARGRGLYDYDPLEVEALNTTSIAQIGESQVVLDQPYQSDAVVTKAIAEFVVTSWSAGGIAEASLKYIPRTQAELDAAMALEPGMAGVVREEVVGINDTFYIQGVGIRIDGDSTAFTFSLQRALVQQYWQLGTSGYSELGVSTVLAPL